ncbi:MAG: hypothetical protein VKK42_21370 [Lyngbya sp.]|nr:hypothetical protein [Lyngbya sp.]
MQYSNQTNTNRPLENNEAFAIFILGLTVLMSLIFIGVKVFFG